MKNTYTQVISDYMPACPVANCGVVRELINVTDNRDVLKSEVDRLRQKQKDIHLLMDNKDEKGEINKKLVRDNIELEQERDALRLEIDASLLEKSSLIQENSKLKVENAALEKKAADVMTYYDADEKIREKQKKLDQLEEKLLTARILEQDIEKKVKESERLNKVLADLTAAIDGQQRYITNLVGYKVGLFKNKPLPPIEYINPEPKEKKRRFSIFRRK